MDSNQYGSPLSNLPPLAWLSGLNFGQTGMSGFQDTSLGGLGGTSAPGMEGGLSLDALSELLQQQQLGAGEFGVGTAGDLLGGIGGNIGQGTLAQGGLPQSFGSGGQLESASQNAPSGYQQTQATADPVALLQKIAGELRPSSPAAPGAAGAGTTGTAFDPTGQLQTQGYQDFREDERGAFSPGGTGGILDILTSLGFAPNQTLSPDPGSPVSSLDMLRENLPGTGGYQTPGTPSRTVGMEFLNKADFGSPEMQQLLRMLDPLVAGQPGFLSQADLPETLGGLEQATAGGASTGLGEGLVSPQRGILPEGYATPTQPQLPVNWGGVFQGGIGSTIGLVNAIRAAQAGSIPGAVGGGLQSVSGLARLLQASPQLAQSLGFTPEMLKGVGVGTGGLGGLLGIATGAQALERGDELGGALGIGGGALSGYNALQALSQAYPSLLGGTLPHLGDAALRALGPDLGSLAQRAFGPAPTAPGGFGSAAGGINLAGAGLGILGTLTGDRAVAELAKAVGGVAQLTSLVGPIASAAASGSAAAMQAATAAAAAAAPAAVVAAVIQMGMALGQGIAAGHSPERITLNTLAAPDLIASNIMDRVINPMFEPSKAWTSFPERVGQTAKLSGTSLGALMQGLPYVQSQEELAQVLDAFKGEVGTRVGGYGEGSGPYDIPGLPGVGTRTHGMKTPAVNFEPFVNQAQQVINALRPMLPQTFASPDNALMRNFARFQDPGIATPQRTYDPRFGPATPYMSGGQMMVPGKLTTTSFNRPVYGTIDEGGQQGIIGYEQGSEPHFAGETFTRPGQPGYDYSIAGAYPDPSAPITTPMSAAWQQLMTGGPPAAAPVSPALGADQLAQLSQFLPSVSSPQSMGLMGLLGGGPGPAGMQTPRITEEEARRMFQQYGIG